MKILIFLLTIMFMVPGCKHEKKEHSVAVESEKIINIAIIGDSTTSGFGANGDLNFDPESEYSLMSDDQAMTQEQQDNVGIPSAVRLLKTYVESINSSSSVINFALYGSSANTHYSRGTVQKIESMEKENTIAFINLGINSAKNGVDSSSYLKFMIDELFLAGIETVIVIPNNIGVCSTLVWCKNEPKSKWVPMDKWWWYREILYSVANEYNLEIIDLGTDEIMLNTDDLHDPFHPSKNGYEKIFNIYKAWTNKYLGLK